MATASDLLRMKSGEILTLSPTADVLEAVRKMNRHRIGALVVVERGRVVGMFTERDVLRLVAALQDVSHVRVSDVMTREVAMVRPGTPVEDIQETMKTRRVRHIPVVDGDGELVGLVSIGDLNAWCVQNQAQQLEGLNDYIYGRT